MSLCFSGLDTSVKRCKITFEVSEAHPLIKLANTIDWQQLSKIVLPGLKKTTATLTL